MFFDPWGFDVSECRPRNPIAVFNCFLLVSLSLECVCVWNWDRGFVILFLPLIADDTGAKKEIGFPPR